MVRIVVVLPMPLRPSSVTTSPAADVEGDVEENLGRAVGGTKVADGQHQAGSSCPR